MEQFKEFFLFFLLEFLCVTIFLPSPLTAKANKCCSAALCLEVDPHSGKRSLRLLPFEFIISGPK